MHRIGPVHAVHPWSGEIEVAAEQVALAGVLEIPAEANGLVLFAHGSGSSRHSSRNRRVARHLQSTGMATLLFDLLTAREEEIDSVTAHLRFDIRFLASRLHAVTTWAMADERTKELPIGYFGASTGAAAALIAAADPSLSITAVVSRGGRPDLAGDALCHVRASTLLIVGGADEPVIELNERAYARLAGVKRLEIVPRASHLFEEQGTLDTVARLAADWFGEHLGQGAP